MTAVFPEMCSNAISTSKFCQHCCCNRVGFYSSSRLSDGGDVIDIDAKCQHWCSSLELARVYSPLSYTETVIRDLPKAAHFWKSCQSLGKDLVAQLPTPASLSARSRGSRGGGCLPR